MNVSGESCEPVVTTYETPWNWIFPCAVALNLFYKNNQQIKYMKHETGYYADARCIAIHSFLHEQLLPYISHDVSVWIPSLIAASFENT